MDAWMDGWVCGRKNGWMDCWTDGRMEIMEEGVEEAGRNIVGETKY